MIDNITILAIIPARGGSKRFPRKNVMPLAGKPLICWTTEAAQKAKYLDRIIVSTDDQEIAAVSRDFGTEVLMRPLELASDTASTIDVVLHVIESLDKKYDFVMLLQPTSPLRNEKHIDEACELLIKKNAEAIISITEMDHSPLWANTLPKDGNMNHFLKPEIIGKRSQDLPTYYRLNGAIYLCNTNRLIDEKKLFLKDKIYSYIMDKSVSIDIDCIDDLVTTEKFLL